jgi:hypothetical protein
MSNILKVNESNLDRIIRIVVGAVLEVLGWGGLVTGVLGIILIILGIILLVTSIVGFCPLYALLGIRTKKA